MLKKGKSPNVAGYEIAVLNICCDEKRTLASNAKTPFVAYVAQNTVLEKPLHNGSGPFL